MDPGWKATLFPMIAAWTAGDLRRLAETYQDAEGLSPEVADALLARFLQELPGV